MSNIPEDWEDFNPLADTAAHESSKDLTDKNHVEEDKDLQTKRKSNGWRRPIIVVPEEGHTPFQPQV